MVLSIGQIELFNHLLYLKTFNYGQTNDLYLIELLVLNNNTWKDLTVCKQMNSGSSIR